MVPPTRGQVPRCDNLSPPLVTWLPRSHESTDLVVCYQQHGGTHPPDEVRRQASVETAVTFRGHHRLEAVPAALVQPLLPAGLHHHSSPDRVDRVNDPEHIPVKKRKNKTNYVHSLTFANTVRSFVCSLIRFRVGIHCRNIRSARKATSINRGESSLLFLSCRFRRPQRQSSSATKHTSRSFLGNCSSEEKSFDPDHQIAQQQVGLTKRVVVAKMSATLLPQKKKNHVTRIKNDAIQMRVDIWFVRTYV